MKTTEPVAKIALEAKFDDFAAGLVFRKLTYPIGHRRFARNPNPAAKGRIWPQMDFCNWLNWLQSDHIDFSAIKEPNFYHTVNFFLDIMRIFELES